MVSMQNKNLKRKIFYLAAFSATMKPCRQSYVRRTKRNDRQTLSLLFHKDKSPLRSFETFPPLLVKNNIMASYGIYITVIRHYLQTNTTLVVSRIRSTFMFSFQSFVQANITNIAVKRSVSVDSADWKRTKQ